MAPKEKGPAGANRQAPQFPSAFPIVPTFACQSKGPIRLSRLEAEIVFSAIIPNFKPDQNGRFRGPASYRGGDNPTALSLDLSEGGKYFDHVTGEGGDVIALVKLYLGGVGFRQAVQFISGLIGRELLDDHPGKRRRRHTAEDLARASQFRVGLIQRIERCLEASKQELWGERHEQAAAVVQDLTQWLSAIRSWNDYKAADHMRTLSRRIPHLVARCVEESADFDQQLARALADSAEKLEAAA